MSPTDAHSTNCAAVAEHTNGQAASRSGAGTCSGTGSRSGTGTRSDASPRSGSDFATRLQQQMQRTGLNAHQLGIARVYDQPRALANEPRYPKKSGELDDSENSTLTSDWLRWLPKGHPVGDLSGKEILLKDLQKLAGEETTMGSIHQRLTADYSDTATLRLLRAGATIVGASVSAEFGTTAYTEPVGLPHPVNPLNEKFMAGGSSGGAAVAVARGLVDIAHATDGGGSIRIPAACCGLTALKPAHDRYRGGFTPTAHGFIAKDIPTTANAYGLELSAPHDLRVGYTNTGFHSSVPVNPTIAAATATSTSLLVTTPAVESVTSAPAPYPRATFDLFSTAIAARCADLPDPLSPLTAWLRSAGQQVPAWRRERIEEAIRNLDPSAGPWRDFDVIAVPTIAHAPPAPGTFSALSPEDNFAAQTAWTPWGTLWNLMGWAAVTVPLVAPSKVPGRWPIALMLGAVGDRVSEGELLALASLIPDATRVLDPTQLSMDEPTDFAALGFSPEGLAGTPAASDCGHGCGCGGRHG